MQISSQVTMEAIIHGFDHTILYNSNTLETDKAKQLTNNINNININK